MAGPLLPFAFDLSRQDENFPPLSISPSKQRKRSLDQNDDDNDDDINKLNKNSLSIYSSLNSSSSLLVDNNNNNNNNDNNMINNNNSQFNTINNYNNTSSTIPNFDEHANNNSSDPFIPMNMTNPDVPSSPILQSQNGFFNKPDPLRSDAFDDLVSINNNNINLKPTIPSSPTLLPLSQPMHLKDDGIPKLETKLQIQRPKLTKQIHPLSRHGSTFTEPNRKKQRMIFNDEKKNSPTPPPAPIVTSKLNFAIDRDGHVFGYNLENDILPEHYSPTLYDEPAYFVVKNSAKQELNLTKSIDEFFEQEVNPKNPISNLNLQYFNLNTLPDYIADIQNFYDCTDDGIIKPFIHIDASYNKLRSINPKLLEMEKLEMFSLRNNKIARLSGKIEKSIGLKSLNLAMNKFKFLPHNILHLKNLKVLAITGNPMIQLESVDKYYIVDTELLKLYSQKFKSDEFLDIDKEIKYFSRIHWLKSNKQISKNAVHASLLSRSLTTIQDLCYDDNGNFKDWNDFNSNNKIKMRKEKQSFVESKVPWCPKLSELSLRKISQYLVSQSEVQRWKNSTSEFIYKRAMNSLIYGTNGETCGYCNENCIESVADMLEWWNFKGSKSVTIKRRFCSKRCATCWMEKLNNFKSQKN